MTDQINTPSALENVGRGATFALLAIPAAIILFAIVAGLFQIVSGIAAIVIPYLAAWLYGKGAGSPLTRKGWAPFLGISAVAVIVGTISGIVAGAFAQFSSVGGNGGLFGAPFLRTLGSQFGSGLGENAIPILIGLGLGGVGIVGVLRGPRNRVTPPPVVTPGAMPPASPPAPNQPSPGVTLNGQPVDPDKK